LVSSAVAACALLPLSLPPPLQLLLLPLLLHRLPGGCARLWGCCSIQKLAATSRKLSEDTRHATALLRAQPAPDDAGKAVMARD
jgi:hypothetical protein